MINNFLSAQRNGCLSSQLILKLNWASLSAVVTNTSPCLVCDAVCIDAAGVTAGSEGLPGLTGTDVLSPVLWGRGKQLSPYDSIRFVFCRGGLQKKENYFIRVLGCLPNPPPFPFSSSWGFPKLHRRAERTFAVQAPKLWDFLLVLNPFWKPIISSPDIDVLDLKSYSNCGVFFVFFILKWF